MKKVLSLLNGIKIERQNIDFSSDENFVAIKGYACHFGEANLNHEIVGASSFDDFFEKLKNAGIMPGFNYMHTDTIIGGWDALTPDEIGLFAEGRLCKRSRFVTDELLPLMEAGFCNYLSTEGFVNWDDMIWNEDNDNYVATKFNLVRISIVDVPADIRQNELSLNAVALRRKLNNKPQHNKRKFY